MIPFGKDIADIVEEARIQRASRKGMMKNSAKKISRCLQRMEELKTTNPDMSNRSIAGEVYQ